LACTFASPCLGREPKARVATQTMFTIAFKSPRSMVAMMVEGDKKSKHIFSLGGWVQITQEVEELVIGVLEKPKFTIQKKAYVVEL
jgi:hypothetical protein